MNGAHQSSSPPALAPEQREKILRLLHADRAQATVRLELLERRLSCFFRWERVTDPAGCAAAAMQEMAVRLAAGAEVLDPEGFALDLAREHRDRAPVRRVDSPVVTDGVGAEAVEGWLAGQTAASRQLLIQWFPFDPVKRKAARAGLASGKKVSRLAGQAIELRERCIGFVRQNLA